MLTFNKPTFDDCISREWIVTNGLGGYASSTICGTNTRRYHGLLVASMNPPTDRKVIVSKLEEDIYDQHGGHVSLSTNQYGEVIHPYGFHHLAQFERKPFPSMTFSWKERNMLVKTIFMVRGRNTTIVEYENAGVDDFTLTARPLLLHRDYHALFHENPVTDFYLEEEGRQLTVYPSYGAHPLFITYSDGEFERDGNWFRNFLLLEEKERGLDYEEDAYSLGLVRCQLRPGQKLYIVMSTDHLALEEEPDVLKRREEELLASWASDLPYQDPFYIDLALSGRQFLVQRKSTDSASIIAGYHWFTDWGRDTMISMRALCLDLFQKSEAKSIVRTFLEYLDQGMIPNRFPDNPDDPLEYNTADASLWLFVVLYEYYIRFEDISFLTSIMDKLTEIILSHVSGTRYGIHVTKEGLLYAGKGNVQLSWMDARIEDYVVTPRHGCPVEINALWYNALNIYECLLDETGKKGQDVSTLIELFENNFRNLFLNDEGYLNDVVIPGVMEDNAFRPNQIYALSLPFPLLDKQEARVVMPMITEKLLTDYGLRSLDPDNHDFHPEYSGNLWQRDTAYHQGSVWPFLLSEYAEALINTYGNTKRIRKRIEKLIPPLQRHFYQEGCIHGMAEIFDGLNPARGKGAIHQAWSVAGMLRLLSLVNS